MPPELPPLRTFPPPGPASHALYQVNDGLAATNGLHNLRIIMAPADEALLYQTNNLMSNDRLGCTVIYRRARDLLRCRRPPQEQPARTPTAAARSASTSASTTDQLFRGIHRTIAIDRSEGQITGCQEILYDQMMSASRGIPAEFNDLVQGHRPGSRPTPATPSSRLARFGDVFLDSQFENGSDGTGLRIRADLLSHHHRCQRLQAAAAGQRGRRQRHQPRRRQGELPLELSAENNEDRDDYSRIIAMAKHFDKTGAAFDTGLDDIIDIDQWLRALAYSCASGAGDSFFANANHNGIFYARPDGRVLYFPHDMDYSFNATRNIFDSTELQKLTANPARHRAYLGHLA